MKYYYGHEQQYQRRLKEGQVAWDAGAYEEFDMLPAIQKFLADSSFTAASPRVLDLGCGTGALAVFLAQRGFEVVAVDISPSAIEEARKQSIVRKTKVEFCVADICDLNLPGASFELITDNHFLHCIVYDEERKSVLSKIHALLKPGGQYWIETMVGHPDMKPRPEWHLDAEGISWVFLDGKSKMDGCVIKDGHLCLPIRRIRNTAGVLVDEIQRAGFELLWQETLPPKDENDTGWFRATCVKHRGDKK